MKTKLVTLALLLISAASFAQTAFTQTTLNELLTEYKTNSKTFFTDRLSADFRYTNEQGKYLNRNDIVQGPAQKILKTEIAEPVIFQSDDLAVVSGIHKTERTGSDGNPATGQVACTYTFQRRQGKWMFVASQQNNITAKSPDQMQTDEAAIKTVCTDFSEQWDKRNRSGVMAHLADVPYASRYFPNNSYNGSATIREAFEKAMDDSPAPTGVKRERSNWQLKPLGDRHYWATFSQVITAPDGSVKYGKEANLLEKIDGQWKLVSVITLPMIKRE
jgi:ketosteroid isomerase-like protein